jgi:hypothetical protein
MNMSLHGDLVFAGRNQFAPVIGGIRISDYPAIILSSQPVRQQQTGYKQGKNGMTSTH